MLHYESQHVAVRCRVLCYAASALYAECHDGVDDIVIVLLQCLDGLVAGNVGLGHDELNVLVLKTGGIDLLLILLLVLLVLSTLDGLALSVVVRVIVSGVVVASVVVLGSSELLSSRSLGLGVKVLNLGLTEDAENS